MSISTFGPTKDRGPIAWMVHNRVTANLLMLVFLVGGLFASWTIKEEIFPDFTLDQVDISVDYAGASPEEVEQGIVLAVEEAIRGIDGIEEITAVAREGRATISAELTGDAEAMRVYQEIQQEIDAITTFPEDAEEPQITLASRQREVLGLAVSGPVSEWTLHELAETVRDRLLQQPDISQLEMRGARDYEIHVEVDRGTLRRYDLTLGDIAAIVDNSSVELPGGSLETMGGEILLRVKQRRDWGREFAEVPVVATGNGGYLHLGDIARISDTFEDDDSAQTFNGDPSIVLQIYRVGDQTPARVAAATRTVMAELTPNLPPGVTLEIDHDMSEVYQQRLDLLLKNAFLGLVLVLVLVLQGLFLEFKLAFWVTLGIPTSFLGAFLFLPVLDVSLKYRPFLELCLRQRYLTVAVGIAVLSIVLGYALSGRMGFTLMPRVEGDRAIVTATLPYGSPMEKVQQVETQLVAAIDRVAEEIGRDRLLESVDTNIQENVVAVRLALTDEAMRPVSTSELTRRWRAATGPLPEVDSLRFESDLGGPGRGAALTVELSHKDIDLLDSASAALAERLAGLPLVTDIKDGFSRGKEQLDFTLLPEGRSLGLSASDLARQVRNAFHGAEALRQQRGRNEVKVMVRLPESQRTSEYDLEQLQVRTPAGTWVPLTRVAKVERGRAYTSIERRDARRTVSVTANVEPVDQTNRVVAVLQNRMLPELLNRYPGLSYSFQGKQADTSDSVASLRNSALAALVIVYAMLAIPFRSYAQPIVVMTAIPFGAVGALLGHLVMGFSLSVVSIMGIIALSGVVVNDSLVLIDYANKRRREGLAAHAAIVAAGTRRFRPILLTTMTTFGGLAPMIFETSVQAKIMIPMAISLGYGILFATFISLLLVPSLYLILDDMLGVLKQRKSRSTSKVQRTLTGGGR